MATEHCDSAAEPRSTEWSTLCCPCRGVHARPAHCTTGRWIRWIRETGVEARERLELQSWQTEKVAGSVSSACLTLCDRPHGLQHARLLCPSPTPGVYSNSCPWSWCCRPTISPSVIPFSFRLQSFPASGSFPVSRLFASGGQDLVGHICCRPGLKLRQVALACGSLLTWTGDTGPSRRGLGCPYLYPVGLWLLPQA